MARTEGEEGGERAAGGRLVRDGGEEARLEVGDGPDGWGPHGGEREREREGGGGVGRFGLVGPAGRKKGRGERWGGLGWFGERRRRVFFFLFLTQTYLNKFILNSNKV